MSKPSDRMSNTLAWDTLTVDQWTALITEMIRRRDLEPIPKVLALMATYHPQEAGDLQTLMLAASSIGGDSA